MGPADVGTGSSWGWSWVHLRLELGPAEVGAGSSIDPTQMGPIEGGGRRVEGGGNTWCLGL